MILIYIYRRKKKKDNMKKKKKLPSYKMDRQINPLE